MWTCSQIIEALGLNADIQGTVFEEKIVSGFALNSQTIEPGQAFIALKGATHDGHAYLAEAWAKGASLLIVEKEGKSYLPEGSSYVLVPSTYEALNQLGAWARCKASHAHVVAVTGSVGKTTTKAWVNQVLSSFGSTVAAIASYNNHTGVPLALTDLISNPDFGVFEVGMNHAGEIEPLAKLIQPHACIITTIGSAHIGNMGSLEAIADEKASIQRGLVEGGVAILPFDNPYFSRLKQPGIKTISFGSKDGADVRMLNYREENGSSYIDVNVMGRPSSYTLPFVGQHYAHNVLAVIALAEHWGLKEDLPLHTLTLSPQRGEIYGFKLASGLNIHVMDDSYNANPTSMEAGLKVFGSLKNKGKRIAVIGEMFELGNLSEQSHRNLLQPLKEARVDYLYAVGSGCLPLVEEWNNSDTCTYAEKATDIIEHLATNMSNHDALFIKGSNASGVRHVMSWLGHSRVAA